MTSVKTTSISILILKVRKALRVTDWTEVVELGETWEKEVTYKILIDSFPAEYFTVKKVWRVLCMPN